MKVKKTKKKPEQRIVNPDLLKPKFDTRRPLNNIKVPEGETFAKERNANRTEREGTIRTYVELFKAALSEGLDRGEIKKLLKLRSDLFDTIEKIVINEEGQVEISKATPYRYYEYLQRQEKCVRDLEYFINTVDEDIQSYRAANEMYINGILEKPPGNKPNPQAAIMAIKAKSDILDKMIKTGQELGIVDKRAKELRVSGNLNLAALPTEKLKDLMSKKIKELHFLVEKEKLPAVYTNMLKDKNEQK